MLSFGKGINSSEFASLFEFQYHHQNGHYKLPIYPNFNLNGLLLPGYCRSHIFTVENIIRY